MDKAMSVASRLMTGRCYPYIYEIGYGSYEESEYWQYSHKEKLTDKQLRQHVQDAIFHVLESSVGNYDEQGFHKDHFHVSEGGPSFQEILTSTKFHDYLKAQGFIRVEYTQRFGIFGWAASLDPKDWDGTTDSARVKFCEELKQRCDEAGIQVEAFQIEKEKQEMEELEERLRGAGDSSEEEVQKTLEQYRTYYHLSLRNPT